MNNLVRDLYCAYMLPNKRNLGAPYSILWGPKSDEGKEAGSRFGHIWMTAPFDDDYNYHAVFDPFYRAVFSFLSNKIGR